MSLECECCGLRNVERKTKGIGMYCERCLHHWAWYEDVGRPGTGTFAETDAKVKAEHTQMSAP